MFIGRKKELESLEKSYKKPGFSMTVITGRRRIGKSTLIKEFIKGKKAVYYTATKIGSERNLELLSEQLSFALEPSLSGIHFGTIERLFDFLTARLGDEKLIFVIDELPYWAEKDEGLLSVMQKYIDEKWMDKNLFLILCGSSLSFMEDEVLSEKSPLFGRRDSQIYLREFDYLEAAEFVPEYSSEDKALCFGVTGGVAKYLALINPKQDIDTNIKRLMFSTDGYLFDEPHNLLTQEFSDISLVNDVIEQVAAGQNTLNLISEKTHESASTVSYSLKRLISVGLIEKKFCIGEEKNKKKVQYVLKDSMFRFWYRFVPEAVSIIELGGGGEYYDKVVKPQLHDFMGKVFEGMCQHFTLLKGIIGEWSIFLNKAGSWWGTETITDKNGRKRAQSADIDVVGISDADRSMVVGECKFKNEPIDQSVYDTLLRRSHAIPISYPVRKYLLFSLSGFTDWYKTNQNDAVELYTLEDMYTKNL
ncbi:MAG: ATP-binding protein [Lachnospiraceae bacterium]|jgi:hypothetical protein|nr:ATP-binding protein [Lachnospiraceae bacterium]